jgi:hypothetical protein
MVYLEKYDENGNLIPPTPAQREAYRIKLKNTTLSVLATRFAFGFFRHQPHLQFS